jgi:hypothetical protein
LRLSPASARDLHERNSGSNDTTGKDCQRYGFRSQPSAYMAVKALAPVLAKELGKGRTASEQLAPLGTTSACNLGTPPVQQAEQTWFMPAI